MPEAPAIGSLLRSNLESGELFTLKGVPGMTERSLSMRAGALGVALGIDNLSAQNCRHYWATRAIRESADPFAMLQAGGWISIATVQTYVDKTAIANAASQTVESNNLWATPTPAARCAVHKSPSTPAQSGKLTHVSDAVTLIRSDVTRLRDCKRDRRSAIVSVELSGQGTDNEDANDRDEEGCDVSTHHRTFFSSLCTSASIIDFNTSAFIYCNRNPGIDR